MYHVSYIYVMHHATVIASFKHSTLHPISLPLTHGTYQLRVVLPYTSIVWHGNTHVLVSLYGENRAQLSLT